MSNNAHHDRSDTRAKASMTLVLIALAFFVVAFVVLAGHRNWFELRPASGTAAAMANAADRPLPPTQPVR